MVSYTVVTFKGNPAEEMEGLGMQFNFAMSVGGWSVVADAVADAVSG